MDGKQNVKIEAPAHHSTSPRRRDTADGQPQTWWRHPVSLVVIGAAVMAVAAPLAWLINRAMVKPDSIGNPAHDRFCCPEQVPILAAFMNDSLDPCQDFFAYSCDRGIQRNYRNFYAHTGEVVYTAVNSPDIPNAPAAAVFRTFYKSCLKDCSRSRTLIQQITSSIMMFGEISEPMPPEKAFRVIFNMNVTCGVRFPFGFSVPRPAAAFLHPGFNGSHGGNHIRFTRSHWSLTSLRDKCSFCVAESLATYNRISSSPNVSMAELVAVDQGFPVGASSHRLTNSPIEKVIQPSQLYKRLPFLNEPALRNAVVGTPLDVSKELQIFYTEGEAVFEVINYFLSPKQPQTSLAYMVVYASIAMFLDLHVNVTHVSPGRRQNLIASLCLRNVLSHSHLWHMVYAQMITDQRKDQFLRQAFTEAQEAVRKQVRSGGIVDSSDRALADRVLDDVTLVLPCERVLADMQPPKARAFYAYNKLLVAEFQYRVLMEKARRGMPEKYTSVLASARHLVVPTDFYRYFHLSYKPKATANLPVSVVRLAASLWELLFHKPNWGDATARNLRKFKECISRGLWERQAKPGGYGEGLNGPLTGASSGALSLALRAVRPVETGDAEWRAPKQVAELARMSHAQFFYTMYAYTLCNMYDERAAIVSVNEPLSRIRDFAYSFACRPGSPMMAAEEC